MKSLNVLIIEDDAIIGLLLSDIITGLGYHVAAIHMTESEAVEAAALYLPDLMIVDIQLAEGSGIGAMEQILAERFVPHIYLSGDLKMVADLRSRAVVIEKPFHESELIQAIRQAMTYRTAAVMN